MRPKFYILLIFTAVFSNFCKAQQNLNTDSLIRIINEAEAAKRARRWKVYPLIAATPETSWMFGVMAAKVFGKQDTSAHSAERVSTYTPFFVYTLRNQFLLDNQVDYFSLRGWDLSGWLRFAWFPNRFFGIGSYADANSETYTDKQFRFRISAGKRVHEKWLPSLVAEVNYDLLKDFEQGLVLDTSDILGEKGGVFWGIGPSITFDSRNNSVFPEKGGMVRLESVYHPNGLGNDYHSNRFSLDARKYFATGKKKRNVLAFQGVFAYNTGNDIPFTRLEELGGDTHLRGFHSERYMDKAMAYLQAEYRFTIWRIIGMVAFAGIGDVYNDSWDFSNPKYSGGLGLRIQLVPSQKLNLRLDYAIGTDLQHGLYFGVKEAF